MRGRWRTSVGMHSKRRMGEGNMRDMGAGLLACVGP